jgi:rhodanese-related sulfurtransferase
MKKLILTVTTSLLIGTLSVVNAGAGCCPYSKLAKQTKTTTTETTAAAAAARSCVETTAAAAAARSCVETTTTAAVEGQAETAAVKCDTAACPAEKCAEAAQCAKTNAQCPKAAAAASAAPLQKIDTARLGNLLAAPVPVLVFDARSGKYDDKKRIPGAQQLGSKSDVETITAAVGDNKDAMIVTYCSGPKCPASNRLATKLQSAGYTNVVEYPEGISGWIAAGNDIVVAE